MSSSERTQEALLARTESLCAAITDPRSPDPSGGTGYLSTILRAVRMTEHSSYSTSSSSAYPSSSSGGGATEFLPAAHDFASSAHRELLIREQTAGLIKTAQEISGLVRELQELWLFGGLDTLTVRGGDEVERERVVEVAGVVEGLVGGGKEGGSRHGEGEGEREVVIKKEES